MKKILTSSFLLFCLFCFSNLKAQPGIAGGHIDYACAGTDSFLVTLHVIADCNNALSFNQMVTATPSCSTALPVFVQLAVQDSFNRTQICEGQCDRCSDPSCTFPYGFREYTFTGIFDLSQSVCDQWTFSWQGSKRSANITTGPANAGIYLYATIDRSVASCNTTSTLSPLESTLTCVGSCFSFGGGGADADGDSLVYSLASPMASSTQNVTYTSPYSFDKPLYFNGFPNANLPFNPPICRGFHLNSSSGSLMFRPMQPQGTVMSLKIEEFRNGQKIAERVRDLMIMPMDCPSNSYPMVTGINGGSSFSTEVCPGQTISFTINSDDQDNDSVNLDWNGGIAGSNFTVSSGKTPTGTFTWTPKESDASAVPYFFTVHAHDNACPLPGNTVQSFRITVKPKPTADYIVTNLGNGLYEFTVTKTNPVGAFVEWSGGGGIGTGNGGADATKISFTHQFSKEDTFAFQLKVISDCINIYQDTVIVEFKIGINEPLSNNANIRLFPNPAKGDAVLVFDKNEFAPASVELLNPEGKIVASWKQYHPGELKISRNGLAKGIYVLRLKIDTGESWQVKLVFE